MGGGSKRDILEANVRVDEKSGAESGVSDWVQRASGKGSDGQGDESGGHQSEFGRVSRAVHNSFFLDDRSFHLSNVQ